MSLKVSFCCSNPVSTLLGRCWQMFIPPSLIETLPLHNCLTNPVAQLGSTSLGKGNWSPPNAQRYCQPPLNNQTWAPLYLRQEIPRPCIIPPSSPPMVPFVQYVRTPHEKGASRGITTPPGVQKTFHTIPSLIPPRAAARPRQSGITLLEISWLSMGALCAVDQFFPRPFQNRTSDLQLSLA